MTRTPVDDHILALREQGVSYPAIARAIYHFTGTWLTTRDVQQRARQLGVPRMEGKVRT